MCGCGEAEAEKEGTVLPKGRAFYVDRVVVLAYEAGPVFVLLLTARDGRRDQCFVRSLAERDQNRTTLLEGVVDEAMEDEAPAGDVELHSGFFCDAPDVGLPKAGDEAAFGLEGTVLAAEVGA